MAKIEHFAEQYGLRLSTDPWNRSNKIVLGKYGFIDAYGKDVLSAVFGCTPKLDFENRSARAWGNARRELLSVGCTMIQRGDTEGVFLFDAGNAEQVDVVIRRLKLRRKRKLSEGSIRKLKSLSRRHGFQSSASQNEPPVDAEPKIGKIVDSPVTAMGRPSF